MQEWATDYYHVGIGCCLLCRESSPGCLCFECNCSKCFWYDRNGEPKCEKTLELKEERRQELIEMYQEIEDDKWEQNLILKKINEKILQEIKESGEIPNFYMCQKCKREFCTKDIFVITSGKEPLCYICQG